MRLPLADFRILDFTHVASGPFATGLLADFGADVIKVESATRMDQARWLGPFRPSGPGGPEGSSIFASLNRNKRSVAINLKDPRGRQLVEELADRCDALVENFSAGVMARLGLGPEEMLGRHPHLIYVSMSGLGHRGPRSHWLSFNVVLQALSGLMLVTGDQGQPPIMVSNSWADFVAGLHGAAVILSAYARMGPERRGTWVDMSQHEANILPLGELLLVASQTQTPVGRWGNRSPDRAPQGCYRCAGEDSWCVISVGEETEWNALVRVLGDESLMASRYNSVDGRRGYLDEIDRKIEAWTGGRPAREVEQLLQAAGVSAAAVRTNVDVMAELPYLAPSYRVVEHPVIGEMPNLPVPIHFRGLEDRVDSPAPLLGEHTGEVLRELLGMGDPDVRQLRADGVLV